MIGIQQARPPFIEFYVEAVPDVPRSHEVGYRVTKDVNYVRIVQPGSKDNLLKNAEEWIKQLRTKAIDGAHDAYPDEWISAIEKKYELWKQGLEAPLNGTSVKLWPILSPAQAQNLISCHLLTIEDVAEMTEQAMLQYGMGGRELKEKAKDWIKGKEIADLAMKENETLKNELAALREELATLKASQVEPYPKKRGRPKLAEAA